MTIRIGDRLPEAGLFVATGEGGERVSSGDIFKNRKVVLFAVPGAFTPTCHEMHLPGFLENLDAIRNKGADLVACVAVNDVDVMRAWAKQSGAQGRITFLADGNGEFARKLGLDVDYSKHGMGQEIPALFDDCRRRRRAQPQHRRRSRGRKVRRRNDLEAALILISSWAS